MKRLAPLLAVLTALLATAQKLTAVDEAGYAALLKSRTGSVVLVDFWATYCGPCRTEMPRLEKLASSLRDRGFVLLHVSVDEPEQEKEAIEFLKEAGARLPSYIRSARDDDRFIRAIDPKWSGAIPALFLYDRTGRKAGSFIGETRLEVVEAAVRKLVPGPAKVY
ncbi:MAG: TlpA family protein disulfide reductase [Bryobacteraceae bacterium]